MFNKILIANRGEIACRVIKTARRLGIKTVAVYSDADQNALHVALADEAIHIGSSASSESYLLGERVIAAAVAVGAEAIHPGYGFLSENAEFAQACATNKIVFVGPPIEAIKAMGSKSAAKTIMEAAGVPLVPGYHGSDQSAATLKASADAMGYPVLLKAVAGGGGKGMRQVWQASEFEQALSEAKRESMASFGNDDMLVEKYLTQPRHVEVQVFCDSHGHGVYLFERDCSVQRRHQKIIEEAPAPNLAPELRAQMGETAVRAAQAIDYEGAGTVEFLLDTDGSFYFMEMNTRLQVEHPVTEMITGQDLVEWQLIVANGGHLPLAQDKLCLRGHAFEARIYAEDPANDFLPTAGKLTVLKTPAESSSVRIDTGVLEGDEVSPFYDPMIAKLVVWGEDRLQALTRLSDALSEYQIGGVTTNIVFLHTLANSRPFQASELDTGFIDKHHDLLFSDRTEQQVYLAALAGLYCYLSEQAQESHDPWLARSGWRLNQPADYRYALALDHQEYAVTLSIESASDPASVSVRTNDSSECTTFEIFASLAKSEMRIQVGSHKSQAKIAVMGNGYALYSAIGSAAFHVINRNHSQAHAGHHANALVAPMNGSVVEIMVSAGQRVETGQLLAVMEAMKMQHSIKAPCEGEVVSLYCAQGDLVDGGTLLFDFSPDEKQA